MPLLSKTWAITEAGMSLRELAGLLENQACTVAASMQGVLLPGTNAKAIAKRERVKLSDLQRV